MYYKIHSDRIILEDENGTRVAEIDYPELRSGLCEITHVYGSESEEGLRQADNLMDLCVREMRQSGRRVIASSKYAADWFKMHPQAQDVLMDSSSISADSYGEFEPRTAGAQKSTPQAESSRRIAVGASRSPVPPSVPKSSGDGYTRSNAGQPAENPGDDWDRTDRILRGETGQYKRSMRRQPAAENPFPTSDKRSQRKAKRQRSAGFAPVSSICRILQLVSFFSMVAILLLYLVSAFLHSEGFSQAMSSGISGRTFVVLSAAFLLFCAVEALWILTKRRQKEALHIKKVKRDCGRGLFAFLIILGIRILCRSITVILPGETGVFDGMIQFASVFEAYGVAITLFAVIGVILCIVRKVLGR